MQFRSSWPLDIRFQGKIIFLRIHSPRDGGHKTKQNQASFSQQDNLLLRIRVSLLSNFLMCLSSFPIYLNIFSNRFSHPNRDKAAIYCETSNYCAEIRIKENSTYTDISFSFNVCGLREQKAYSVGDVCPLFPCIICHMSSARWFPGWVRNPLALTQCSHPSSTVDSG